MLTRASLRYYAGTNALVVLGVAVAVAVLAGALLVGVSVRESLRQIALGRLGATDAIITAPMFFRSALADDLVARSPQQITAAAPLIVAAGAVTHAESRRTAGHVTVYGIDQRFGRFHGIDGLTPGDRDALISEALAAELGAKVGDAITLTLAKPTDIPLASIQGRRDSTGERIRLTVSRVLDRASLGDFSLSPSQGPVLAIYVPLERLQKDLDLGPRVNTLLVQGVGTIIPLGGTLDDLGLRSRIAPSGETIIESRAGVIQDELANQISKIAERNHRAVEPVLTYVANAIRIADREVTYSTISAINLRNRGIAG
ncbi:MAG: ABC transporter permease, partial [Acidobacteriota bacterium]